jgi:hypothetical protein
MRPAANFYMIAASRTHWTLLLIGTVAAWSSTPPS